MRHRHPTVAVGLIVLVAVALVSSFAAGRSHLRSGISGQVFLAPTCPGPQRVGGPPCRRPLATGLIVTGASRVKYKTRSDADGRFHIALHPGHYDISPQHSGPGFGSARATGVRVLAGRYTRVTLTVDSGIR